MCSELRLRQTCSLCGRVCVCQSNVCMFARGKQMVLMVEYLCMSRKSTLKPAKPKRTHTHTQTLCSKHRAVKLISTENKKKNKLQNEGDYAKSMYWLVISNTTYFIPFSFALFCFHLVINIVLFCFIDGKRNRYLTLHFLLV